MGFLSLLTLLFIGAKLFGAIDWSWWLVLMPTIVELFIVLILCTYVTFKVWRS